MVPPCRNVQPIDEVLEDCKHGILPIILYAVNKDTLSSEQVNDLRKVRETLPFPVCFIRIPSGPADPESETDRSALHKQLVSLDLISSSAGNCACGAPAQTPGGAGKMQSILGESLERLHRALVPFTRQVLQNQQADAANLLNSVHCHCLDLFINQVTHTSLYPPISIHNQIC